MPEAPLQMKWREFGAAALPPAPNELGGLLPRPAHKQLLTHQPARGLFLILVLILFFSASPGCPTRLRGLAWKAGMINCPWMLLLVAEMSFFFARVETQIVIPWSWCVSVDSFSWFTFMDRAQEDSWAGTAGLERFPLITKYKHFLLTSLLCWSQDADKCVCLCTDNK